MVVGHRGHGRIMRKKNVHSVEVRRGRSKGRDGKRGRRREREEEGKEGGGEGEGDGGKETLEANIPFQGMPQLA